MYELTLRGRARPGARSRLSQSSRAETSAALQWRQGAPRVCLPGAQHVRASQRIGGALANTFRAADDPPVKLALILTAFHAYIIAIRQAVR